MTFADTQGIVFFDLRTSEEKMMMALASGGTHVSLPVYSTRL
jgi:hypothetical protein